MVRQPPLSVIDGDTGAEENQNDAAGGYTNIAVNETGNGPEDEVHFELGPISAYPVVLAYRG